MAVDYDKLAVDLESAHPVGVKASKSCTTKETWQSSSSLVLRLPRAREAMIVELAHSKGFGAYRHRNGAFYLNLEGHSTGPNGYAANNAMAEWLEQSGWDAGAHLWDAYSPGTRSSTSPPTSPTTAAAVFAADCRRASFACQRRRRAQARAAIGVGPR